MIQVDYGKQAYLKLQDIERRIENLEKIENNNNYSELEFYCSKQPDSLNFSQTFEVDAVKEGKFYIKGNMLISLPSMLGVIVKVYVNDVMCYNFACTVDVEYPFSFQTAFNKGLNFVRVEMSSPSKFSLEYLNLTVNGFVNYKSTLDNSISIINDGNKDYILHYKNNTSNVYLYDGVNSLILLKRDFGLVDAQILGVDDTNVYFLIISESDTLGVKILNKKTFYTNTEWIGMGGVDSITGRLVDGVFKILFTSRFELYEGTFNMSEHTFNFKKLGKKSIKVFSEPSVEDCYVITDRFSNSNLYIDGVGMINLPKGDKYHVYKGDGEYYVEFTDGNKILRQTITGVKRGELKTVEYAEERVKTFDGKWVVRIRDNLTIKE